MHQFGALASTYFPDQHASVMSNDIYSPDQLGSVRSIGIYSILQINMHQLGALISILQINQDQLGLRSTEIHSPDQHASVRSTEIYLQINKDQVGIYPGTSAGQSANSTRSTTIRKELWQPGSILVPALASPQTLPDQQ